MTSSLKLDFCDAAAARFACERFHYSHTYPAAKSVRIGVWEFGVFIGAIVYSVGGGNATSGRAFGLADRFEVCELQRVALRGHLTTVTRILAISFKLLRSVSPGIKVIVSFADPSVGHHGGIYQGGNWVYLGETTSTPMWELTDGRWVHQRTIGRHWGKVEKAGKIKTGRKREMPPKYKYALALDPAMRPILEAMRKPYPKRAGSSASGTSGIQPGGDGATPIPALEGSEVDPVELYHESQ